MPAWYTSITVKLIFIRHGESEGNHFGILQGRLDYQLTNKGRKQAEETARNLETLLYGRTLIFSSDLSRAWETAVIVSESLRLPMPIPDARLRERHMGTLQNQHWTKLDKRHFESYIHTHGMESHELLTDRVNTFLDMLHDAETSHLAETIVAVTHAGLIRHLYEAILEASSENSPHVENASLHIFNVEWKGEKASVSMLR